MSIAETSLPQRNLPMRAGFAKRGDARYPVGLSSGLAQS
jgi:hypothetical protein